MQFLDLGSFLTLVSKVVFSRSKDFDRVFLSIIKFHILFYLEIQLSGLEGMTV